MITIYKFIKRSKKKERIRNEFYKVIPVEDDLINKSINTLSSLMIITVK
jgi:hypothetical protein